MKVKNNPAVRQRIKKTIQEFTKLQTKTGWFESAVYPDGTPVAGIAAVHENGVVSKGIPPRSFFRTTSSEKRQEWIKFAGEGAKAALEGKATAHQVMEKVGLTVQADVQKTIANMPNDLNDKTKQRRKNRKNPPPNESEAALRDTMYLFNTLISTTESK